jgi:hypothetical protein
LQNQRRTNGGVDRRVPAGEHQREALIRELRIGRSSVQPFRQHVQLLGRNFMPAPSSVHIDHLSPRDGQQPSFWVRRTPFHWPICQR